MTPPWKKGEYKGDLSTNSKSPLAPLYERGSSTDTIHCAKYDFINNLFANNNPDAKVIPLGKRGNTRGISQILFNRFYRIANLLNHIIKPVNNFCFRKSDNNIA